MISDCISNDIPPQMNFFNMVTSLPNALLEFCLKLECCKPHKTQRHPTKCDKMNGVKLFPTVCHIHKFLMFSNQVLYYKSKVH